MKKTFLIAFGFFCIMFVSIMLSSNAQASTITSGSCGNNARWYLDSDGVLSITGTGEMTNDLSNQPWSGYLNQIQSVKINSGITYISSYAFKDCTNLTKVEILGAVKYIGSYAFSSCTNLENVELPEGLAAIFKGAFCGCIRLKSITLPETLTYIDESDFEDCTSLTSISIPNNVNSIGESAFKNCANLQNISFPSNSFTIGDYAFSSCTGIKEIELPSSVWQIGLGVFYECNNMSKITIPFIGREGVVGMDETWPNGHFGYIFGAKTYYQNSTYVPESLKEVVVDCGATNDYAFYNCKNITSITFTKDFSTIGNEVFAACYGLVNLTIPGNITNIGESAFNSCESLESIDLPSSLIRVEKDAFNDCISLKKVNIHDVGAWCNIWFSNLESNPLEHAQKLYVDNILVTHLIIPSETSMIRSYAFAGCTSLTSVRFPSNSMSIYSSAFRGCKITAYYDKNTNVTKEQYGGTIIWKLIEIGDINYDSQVNSDDAIRFLMHTQFPDDSSYSVDYETDYNGDGLINSDDAIYILMHTQFPDVYPLDPKKYAA